MLNSFVQIVRCNHINQIIPIEKESYANPWTEEHFKKDVRNPISLNFLYKKNNKLIGYLFGYLIKDEYHLNKITIKKKYRQKKIGSSLFSCCLSELINKNVRCIQLEVSSLNLTAQKFYKNLNFIKVGVRKNYYSKNEHALLYNLEIK